MTSTTSSGPSRRTDRRCRLCSRFLKEAGLLGDGLELFRKDRAVLAPLRGVIHAARALLGVRVLGRGREIAGKDLAG
eukprot:5446413-Alexandrium_andersonii.AAC.1